MCEPVSIALAVTAAATAGSMIYQNQQIQHQKGAAEAQQTAADAAAREAAKVGPAQTSTATTTDASIAAAEARRKAALRRGILSTIATSGSGVKTGSASSQPTAYAPGSKETLG